MDLIILSLRFYIADVSTDIVNTLLKPIYCGSNVCNLIRKIVQSNLIVCMRQMIYGIPRQQSSNRRQNCLCIEIGFHLMPPI